MGRETVEVPDPGSARSFWLNEALADDPGEACPALRGRIATDVCIVGGGFAGLWTAIELTEREPSLRIVLLESDICGGGASGRNGGFLSSSWHDLRGLCGIYGEEPGLRYARALASQIDEAKAWCEANRADVWFHDDGAVSLYAGEWQRGAHEEAVAFAARMGVPEELVPLDQDEVRAHVDSPPAVGGVFIRDSATVQPARLARELRRVALERGVRIFEGTKARAVEHERPAIVRAEHGAVRADQVVLTIGAWASGWPGFRRAFGVISDYMVATEPIPERIEDIGWRTHVGFFDARELFWYLRRTDDGRIAIGGGATETKFGGFVDGTRNRGLAGRAAEGVLHLFPQLDGVRFEYAWGGPMDFTATWTPFFETRPPGNVHAGLGFSGHGLAAAKLGGKTLASLVLGEDDEWTQLPVVGPPVAKAPPEPLRWPLVRSALWALESGDRRRDDGRRRGFLQSVIGDAPINYRYSRRRPL